MKKYGCHSEPTGGSVRNPLRENHYSREISLRQLTDRNDNRMTVQQMTTVGQLKRSK